MKQLKNKTINVNNSKNNLGKKFWTKNIFLISFFLFFVTINIIRPENFLRFSWHYGFWLPFTTYVVFIDGKKYLKIYQLLLKRIVSMDTLIGLAAHFLYFFSFAMVILNWNAPMYSYGQFWEGAGILIVVTNIGHEIEEKIRKSSTIAYEKLEKMKNSQVIKIIGSKQIKTSASNIKLNEKILVKKGELVGIDGIVLEKGQFSYANITGEAKTIFLKKGQEVISGAHNLGDAIKIQITKIHSDSTLSKIISKIEDLAILRPTLQKIADKIIKWFVPVILLIAILNGIIWGTFVYFLDFRFFWMSQTDSGWMIGLIAAATVMAIACPCALGIATPLVYSVSSLLLTQNGILINEPKALEEIGRAKIFAFDKTGTITNEILEIEEIKGDKKWIGVAKALEQKVKHPIAQTILTLKVPTAKVKNIRHTGSGVKGFYQNQKVEIKRYNKISNFTNIALYVEGKVKLIFKLKNSIKKDVKKTIKWLNKIGLKTVMITGDHEMVATNVAKNVGIKKVYANINPGHKSEIIKELQKDGKVAFIGDGFNDTIAIKQANISVAFASGSDLTNALSDISILKSSFKSIQNLLLIAKMNNNRIKLALYYAFLFNIIAIPAAALLLISPWLAASVMAMSGILVAFNAYIYRIKGTKKLKKINKTI